MKLNTLFGLTLSATLFSTSVQAGIGGGSSGSMLSSKERCASALNSYLSYRHENDAEDAYKVQKLEDQVDALCQGYQVQLMENDGVMTGVVELAE